MTPRWMIAVFFLGCTVSVVYMQYDGWICASFGFLTAVAVRSFGDEYRFRKVPPV